MTVFATPTPITATVVAAGARVRVTATARTDTVVRVEPVDRTSEAHIKVAEGTRVDFTGDRLSVKTTASGAKTGSVAVTIDLPAGSALVAYLAHAGVEADGAFGDCELHAASSRVRLGRVEALRANIAAGELVIDHVAGPVTIDGSVVVTRIGEVGGALRLTGSGGRTWIGHARADVDFAGGSGGFDIDRADGDVTARTGDGAIRIGRPTRGRAGSANRSGTPEVGLGEGAAARLDLDSERGSVRDRVTSHDGPDAVGVHARTRQGDIVVHRAAG
ncbi:hypothetical protein FHX81_2217 [Saccharothrix saharensis]|uniref:Adhesin n=1 Tax=Saccharothrix saharensis TaxID=571190 RepID=A0A543JAN9_9PSEU|nr:hypothetical protein [Saccharothrix saharensis]TQM79905.1 hypothetical protein FHX81_2217 [Saccharothrix saharensis]